MAEYSRIETLLSGLHYLDSDIRIEFGETIANHAHIHSSVLAANCPGLDLSTASSQNNNNNHCIFAVGFQSSTCVLEPLTTASVLSSDIPCHRFHDSSLAPPGWSTPRHDDDYRGQAARNQNLYAKRQYITILNILYGETVTLDDLEPYPSRDTPLARLHSATTSVIETCARAEALGCLSKVANVLMALVFEWDLLGQCVAQTPIKFLKLATKVKSKKLFFMASRHICADRKLAKNWFDASVYYNVNYELLELQLALMMGRESQRAQKLLQALPDVQLCRTHMVAAATTHSSCGPSATLLNTLVKQSYCGECIARTFFAEWLSDKLKLHTSSFSDGQPEANIRASSETLRAAFNQLQRFTTTLMPFQVFSASSNTHKTLAHELGLCGELLVERDIKFHLDNCVQEAAAAINEAFSSSQTELTEQNFPSLGGSSTTRKVSNETYTTSAGQSVFSDRPSTASTSVSSVGESAADLSPVAVSFTYNEDGSASIKHTAALKAATTSGTTEDLDQRASRVESLSPPLRVISSLLEDLFKQKPQWLQVQINLQGSQDNFEASDEACLPSDLLAELDEPSDERWKLGASKHYRCCGSQREDGLPGGHQCRRVKVAEVKWFSELRVAGQDKSIW